MHGLVVEGSNSELVCWKYTNGNLKYSCKVKVCVYARFSCVEKHAQNYNRENSRNSGNTKQYGESALSQNNHRIIMETIGESQSCPLQWENTSVHCTVSFIFGTPTTNNFNTWGTT